MESLWTSKTSIAMRKTTNCVTTLNATRQQLPAVVLTLSSLPATSLRAVPQVLRTSRLRYRTATGHLLQALATLLSSYCSARELTLDRTFRQGVGELISQSHVHTGTKLENVWTYTLYAWKFTNFRKATVFSVAVHSDRQVKKFRGISSLHLHGLRNY
jgi:hypothetical protein